MKHGVLVTVVALALVGCGQTTDAVRSKQVVIQGSDTEVQVVSALVEAFSQAHPDAQISVAGGGSAVGIAALINGETDIANSSRQMKETELQSARDRGFNPVEFILARDGLSIIVHPSNPVRTLSMQQLAALYSGKVTNWKDVGGNDAPVVLYGRQSTSGTYGFFRDVVVQDDYAESMRQMEGTQAIVDSIVSDKNGIGYVGVGYVKTADGTARKDIVIVPVAIKAGETAVSPLDTPAVLQGKYPIFRRIYQYLPVAPAKDSLVAQLLNFEMSEQGMHIVQKQGFYPLVAEDIAHNRSILDALR